MIAVLPIRDMTPRRLWQTAFIGGLALSAIAILVLVSFAYFAGTAPRLPPTAALENPKAGSGAWPPVAAHPLGSAKTLPVDPAATRLSQLPRSTDPTDAPPIDAADLPPPEHHYR